MTIGTASPTELQRTENEAEHVPTPAALGRADWEARRPDDVPARSAVAKHTPPTARAGRRNAQSTNDSLFLAAAVGAAAGSLAKQSLRSGGGQSCVRAGVDHADHAGAGEVAASLRSSTRVVQHSSSSSVQGAVLSAVYQ